METCFIFAWFLQERNLHLSFIRDLNSLKLSLNLPTLHKVKIIIDLNINSILSFQMYPNPDYLNYTNYFGMKKTQIIYNHII